MTFGKKLKTFCLYMMAPLVVITSFALWPLVLGGVIINEVWRTFLHNIVLRRRYKLIPNSGGNFHMLKYSNGRMVLVALYSETHADTVEDIVYQEQHVFRERVFQKSPTCSGHPELKMTFVVKHGYSWFRDDSNDSFQVSEHVKYFDACVPSNVDGIFTEQELVQEILPNHLSKNMDESKPQWVWLVFPHIRRENGSINSLRIFRWDHLYMDGASVGILLAECIFDKWSTPYPPYFRNPKLPPSLSLRRWEALAKFWAWLHLPMLLIGGIFSKFFVRDDGSRPFSAYENKGLKSFSTSCTLERQLLRDKMKENSISSMASALSSILGPVLYGIYFKLGGKKPMWVEYNFLTPFWIFKCVKLILWNAIVVSRKPVIVCSLQALPPYRTPLVNKYTALQIAVPLSSSLQICEFEMNLQQYFVNVIGTFFGRLSIPWMNFLAGPIPSTVCLNSIPLLRKYGTIQGKVIHEVASWSFLFSPVGFQLTALGYGEKLFLTGHSVEGCFDHQEIEKFVKDYAESIELSCSHAHTRIGD